MLEPRRLGPVVVSVLALLTVARAEAPQGRGGLWEIGVSAGASILDSGYDDRVFGYRIPSNSDVPIINTDNLDGTIPTLGITTSYAFTRYFAVELAARSGETVIGGAYSFQTKVTNPSAPFEIRRLEESQQTATAPNAVRQIDGLTFDYLGGTLTSVFMFNNKPTSRWTYYFVVGGGGYSLNPDTESFNDCPSAGNTGVIIDPSLSQYNGFPPDSGRPESDIDWFQDNVQRIYGFDLNCGRAFQTAKEVSQNPSTYVYGQATWANTVVVTDPMREGCDEGQQNPQCAVTNPMTGQFLYTVPPQSLAKRGYSLINPIHGETSGLWTVGGGASWHLKPRHALKFDARRQFDESNNKNINEFTVGYSFMLGKGRDARMGPLAAPEAGEGAEPGEVPPPTPGEGTIPPPEDPEAGRLTLPQARAGEGSGRG